MSNIKSIIKKIDSLKPVPQVANKVMSIAKDPNSSMSDLSKVIVYDAAVTAKEGFSFREAEKEVIGIDHAELGGMVAETWKFSPVVVITTEGSKQRLVEFFEKGAMDYIKKPLTPEEIKEKLNLIMGEPQYEERILDNGDEELDF